MAMTRRRFLAITGATAGLALLPGSGGAAPHAVSWRGRALGAPAELVLHHEDRAAAEGLIRRVVAEIARLESIFSLYRPDSALSELNRSGALALPPPELVALLERSREFWHRTDGAFDPTMQALWRLYADHFSRPGADPTGPGRGDLRRALERVGMNRVVFAADRIVLPVAGMALTLNGIAQGYITDRAIAILRAGGITRTLADLGEIRALGRREDGTPWRIGIAGHPGTSYPLVDRAVATSSPSGFRFAGPHSPSHILDPRSGGSPDLQDSVTVFAPDATTADALSTGFSLLARDRISDVLRSMPQIEAVFHGTGGARPT